MRIYISGAITGTEDAVERFELWENLLKMYGWDVVNPQKVCSSIGHWEHQKIMKICFNLLAECDAVCFIPGWKQSFGANQEYGYAYGTDMIILTPKEVSDLSLKHPVGSG